MTPTQGHKEKTDVDHPNVANENELEWGKQSHGETFGYRRKSLSSATGSEKLGCSLYEVPPWRKAWPYHYHLANEEAIYVLRGLGTIWLGKREVAVSRGGYAALPAGEPGAHQIINTSDETLRYLCFSTMVEPDVMIYPDSDKVGLFAGSAPGGPKEKSTLSKFLRGNAEIGYYEGEE